jgi:hypothetical protein
MDNNCKGCTWAYCPETIGECPCKLCIVKCMCSQSCEGRNIEFNKSKQKHIFSRYIKRRTS